jgi:hypothetical protein
MGCLSCAGFVKEMGGATRLALKEPLSATVEADCLTPESLAGWGTREITALPVAIGSDKATLGDVFILEPGLTEDVILEGDLSRINGIGKSMGHSRLTVLVNAGPYFEGNMRGGEILVQGDAGEYAWAQTIGGLIRIRGNAGDRAGDELGGDLRSGLIAGAWRCGRLRRNAPDRRNHFYFREAGRPVRHRGGVRRHRGPGRLRRAVAILCPELHLFFYLPGLFLQAVQAVGMGDARRV